MSLRKGFTLTLCALTLVKKINEYQTFVMKIFAMKCSTQERILYENFQIIKNNGLHPAKKKRQEISASRKLFQNLEAK